jgi:hypothetical protein
MSFASAPLDLPYEVYNTQEKNAKNIGAKRKNSKPF